MGANEVGWREKLIYSCSIRVSAKRPKSTLPDAGCQRGMLGDSGGRLPMWPKGKFITPSTLQISTERPTGDIAVYGRIKTRVSKPEHRTEKCQLQSIMLQTVPAGSFTVTTELMPGGES